MRTFDYQKLPSELFSGKAGDANVRLYEDRGKFELIAQAHPEQLAALRAQAHFDNVDASARVDGIYVDAARVRDLIAGAAPTDETEAQIVGYSRALALVERKGGRDGRGGEGEQDGQPGRGGQGGRGSQGGQGGRPDAADATEKPAGQVLLASLPSHVRAAVSDVAPAKAGVAGGGGAPDGPLPLGTSAILALYETLYAHRALGTKSRYRKKDYAYVQVDGHMQAMPVSPITAFETPLVLGGACDSLSDVFQTDACSPLILNAVFTVDFLCIRPFDEGNGRIARLFADLMLMRAGFDIARYVSVDRIIEGVAMDYYDALNACVEGWDRSRNSYAPYVRFWLDVVHEAYGRLFELVPMGEKGKVQKSERVRLFVQRSDGPVTKRQVMEALPDISEATVESALGKLVKSGEAEKLGAGRSTAYRWKS